METKLSNYLKDKLINSFLAQKIPTNLMDLFKATSTTIEKFSANEIEYNNNKVKTFCSKHKNAKVDFFNYNGMMGFLWSEGGLVSINQTGLSPKYVSDTYRFGYMTERGEIVLLFNGEYVADCRADAIDIFGIVEEWVKCNYFGNARAFAQVLA